MAHFSSRAFIRWTITFLVAGIVSPRLVLAQDRVSLRLDIPAGTTWTFTQTEQADLMTTMSAGGQQQQVPQKITRTISGKVEVLESNGGVPSVVRVTFDPSSSATIEQMGQQQPLPLPLAGKTVTVTLRDGTLSHDFKGPLDRSAEQELRSFAEMDQHLLPRDPVQVTDSWTPDREALARQWQLDPQKNKVEVNVMLKELTETEGKRVAVLAMTAAISGPLPEQPSLSGKRDVMGTAQIDVKSGRVLSANMSGTLEAAGTSDIQGTPVQIATRGTLSSKSETQTVPASGPGGAGAAAAKKDAPAK